MLRIRFVSAVSRLCHDTSAMKRRSPPLALLLLASLFLIPQLWLVSLALRSSAAVYEFPPRILPAHPTLENLGFVFAKTQVPMYLWNSAKLAFLAMAATLLVGVPAAFVLSRERFKGQGAVRNGLLVVQMVSPLVLLVPIYTVITALGLLDTHAGLALTYCALQLPFTIAVLAGFFDALPNALFEAARLDGASRMRTLTQVALPILGPGLAATAIFNLAAYWSEFGLALVLLDSQQRYTVPVGLFALQSGYETEWQLVSAAALVGILPVMIMFVFLQRYFVSGLTAGAVKG
jgi:multiple sugar transport system permease protein